MATPDTKKTNQAPVRRTTKVKQAVRARSRQHVSGFADFVRTQGVIGLAIGFVMGAQAKALVDSLTNSFINPMVGLLLPGSGSLAGREFHLWFNGKEGVFKWGDFTWALVNFLIIALVIYLTFKVLKLDKLDKPKS